MAGRVTDAVSMAEWLLALVRMEILDHHAPFAMASIQTSRLAPRIWRDRTRLSRPSQAPNVIGVAAM